MDDYQDVDARILAIARKLFIQEGLQKTEMKDIAGKLGNSRSTLYRHFPGKESIVFRLANDMLMRIMDATKLPNGRVFESGYAALSCQMNSMVQVMLANADEIVFLRDFDCLYTKEYPAITASTQYESYIKTTYINNEMRVSMNRGIADGSIRRMENPELTLLTMINGCFAVAQRILPREKHYLIENGYGREMLTCFMEMALYSIQGNGTGLQKE